MPPQHQDTAHWSVDRRVPLALIVAMVVQTATIIWWASNLSSRVASLEEARTLAAPQSDRLTRVEVKIENVQAGVERIERLIRREP